MMQGEAASALRIDQPVHGGVPVSGTTQAKLTLVVDGCTHEADVDTRTVLPDAMREHLGVVGQEDSQFPVHAERKMADAIPGTTSRVLQHTAHLAARENPDSVSAGVAAFLAPLPAAAAEAQR
jgi:pimeloyl-ACP methyl ester carboxylesterase